MHAISCSSLEERCTMKTMISLLVILVLFTNESLTSCPLVHECVASLTVSSSLKCFMVVPLPLNNADHSKVTPPCSGGDPSPGPSCRCYSNSLGYSKCLAKSGSVPCDYHSDCGIAPPGVLGNGAPATTVPAIGASCPSWLTFIL